MPVVPGDADPNPSSVTGAAGARHAPQLDLLKRLIDQAGELLPSQGPITAFVFLNVLQGLEHLPFDEGVRKGARLFGCQPYLTEDRLREKLSRGRISVDDLEAVVGEDLGPCATNPSIRW